MTVQIDIDGTVTAAPDFFRWLTRSLRKNRHKVLIVSSRTISPDNDRATAKELDGYGVVYDRLFLTPALKNLDAARFPPGLKRGQELYLHKLFTAEDNGVDVLFDDCGITTELFRRHLRGVMVFRLLP